MSVAVGSGSPSDAKRATAAAARRGGAARSPARSGMLRDGCRAALWRMRLRELGSYRDGDGLAHLSCASVGGLAAQQPAGTGAGRRAGKARGASRSTEALPARRPAIGPAGHVLHPPCTGVVPFANPTCTPPSCIGVAAQPAHVCMTFVRHRTCSAPPLRGAAHRHTSSHTPTAVAAAAPASRVPVAATSPPVTARMRCTAVVWAAVVVRAAAVVAVTCSGGLAAGWVVCAAAARLAGAR